MEWETTPETTLQPNVFQPRRPRNKLLPSIIDQYPSYDISEDILNLQASAKLGQLLKYLDQKRNLTKIIKRSKNKETHLANRLSSDEENSENIRDTATV